VATPTGRILTATFFVVFFMFRLSIEPHFRIGIDKIQLSFMNTKPSSFKKQQVKYSIRHSKFLFVSQVNATATPVDINKACTFRGMVSRVDVRFGFL